MITGADVLRFYRPDGGWYIFGDSFDGIEFISCDPITKEQFDAGFALVEESKTQQAAAKAAAEAKLVALGLTVDDLKAIGLA